MHPKDFTLKNLRKVTDKRNDFTVSIKAPKFVFADYSHNQVYDPDYVKKVNFADLIENVAICVKYEKFWLINGDHEKFIAKKLNMNFWDLTLDSEKYFEHFMIVKPNKLSLKLFWKDVLYIYDDNLLFVSKSKLTIPEFRKLRNIK